MTDIILEKINEVHIRVRTDDMGILKELSDFFTFFVPGYKFMPSYKCKAWDGKVRLLDAMTGRIYAGLEKYIEHFCKERGYTLDYAYDNSAINFSVVEAKQFLLDQKFTLTPRDYQIDAFVDAVRYNRILFLSPTASGKSFIIYMILRWYLKPTLIVVPTTTLVHQMYSDFAEYGFKSDKYCHKIFSGQDKDTDKPIVITTWQSVYKLPKNWFDKFDVVIGDEAHLFKSNSLSNIMGKLQNCKYRYGFTGTLDGTKTHKLVLEGLFGPVNQVTTTKKLMDQEHLADFKIKILSLGYNDENKKVINSLSYHDELDFLVSHQGRNNFIKNLTLSLEGNTLLLFQFVDKHGKLLYNMIKDNAGDRRVFFVHGGVSGEERDEIRAIVEEEKDAIIIASYGTFSTGVNIRNLHSVIFASPSKSKIRNLQSIGRALRRSTTKEKATLYDIADDLTWRKNLNFTMRHLLERVKIYDDEKFEYKFYKVSIE
jgi:superfamily II DNA or RNA helicase